MLRALAVAIILCGPSMFAASGVLGDPAPERTEHTAEFQVGAGVGAMNTTFPVLHAHARYSLWRTIGVGAYTGGMFALSDNPTGAIIPLCARLNLSLPFWRSFEPMASLGVGTYWSHFDDSNDLDGEFLDPNGSDNGFHGGGHFALALLFPGEKRGFGVEASVHWIATGEYGEDAGAVAAIVGIMMFR